MKKGRLWIALNVVGLGLSILVFLDSISTIMGYKDSLNTTLCIVFFVFSLVISIINYK